MNSNYYAIMITGYGARRRYSVQRVSGSGTNPTNGKTYRTEGAAMAAAAEMGVEIERIGDFYEIIKHNF